MGAAAGPPAFATVNSEEYGDDAVNAAVGGAPPEGAAVAGVGPHGTATTGVALALFACGGALKNESGGATGINGVALVGSGPADIKGGALLAVGGALEKIALLLFAAADPNDCCDGSAGCCGAPAAVGGACCGANAVSTSGMGAAGMKGGPVGGPDATGARELRESAPPHTGIAPVDDGTPPVPYAAGPAAEKPPAPPLDGDGHAPPVASDGANAPPSRHPSADVRRDVSEEPCGCRRRGSDGRGHEWGTT